MLIRFAVKNFLSFNEEALFSMVSGRTQKHENHLFQSQPTGFAILRMALLYGANASGKSNLIRAMDFAQDLIIEGTRPKQYIDFKPFRLCEGSDETPSRFEFEFVAGGQAYAYGFILSKRRIHEEWLFLIQNDVEQEEAIFERTTNVDGVTQAQFSRVFFKDLDGQFLDFVAHGTRANQLLFTELVEKNVDALDPIDAWFRHTLVIIFPQSQFTGTEIAVHANQDFSQALSEFLHNLNTGIDEVCLQKIDIDSLDVPEELLESLRENLSQEVETSGKDTAIVIENSGQRRFMLRRSSDHSIEGYSLATVRRIGEHKAVFEVSEESDGTRRLFDLFPIIHAAEEKVFVVDELERSLHPNLVRQFLQTFLNSQDNKQLIVTTHESILLDLSLLRRDEIWFVEKSPLGASTLYSLEEFRIRHDLDIRKGYLQGRFGAIPVFGSSLISENQEE